MRCAAAHENADGAKFCGECGLALATSPPAPGTMPPSPPGSVSAPEADVGNTRHRARILLGVGAAVLAIAAVLVVLLSGGGESAEDEYLAAIADAGLDDWSTDRAAVNAGYLVCESLDNGGPERGSERDRLAVEHLCDDYLAGFRVLEDQVVRGSFTVLDFDDFTLATEGTPCFPDGGYGDINASTQAVVRNSEGVELARTSLGSGAIGGSILMGCRFEFDLSLTEGESIYILSVGDRGEISYTWAEITEPGAVALSLGEAFD